MKRKIMAALAGALGLVASLIVALSDRPVPAPVSPASPATAPVSAGAETGNALRATLQAEMKRRGAHRVFYRDVDENGTPSGGAEWGTMCALPGGGHLTVAHVAKNGVPAEGPKEKIFASKEFPNDWAFVGVDPKTLRAEDFPRLRRGQIVTILGYPARDRDGEEIRARVYMDDNDDATSLVWLELLDAGEVVTAEGVVGGISGSCVLSDQGLPIASVHANGFSKIDGTTNTWALVTVTHDAILEAQGKKAGQGVEGASPLALLSAPRPDISHGRYGLIPADAVEIPRPRLE